MKGYIVILFLTSLSLTTFSQKGYKWKSEIDSISSAGFYKIQLPPAITSKFRSDFSDIRIVDAKQQEVPYIAQSEQATAPTILFKEYKILKLDKDKKETTLTLQNPAKSKIDNIQLVIKNADVNKVLRLSGSNDNTQWYIIKDNYLISDVYSQVETSVVKIFNFPLSDYEFFKIDISDSLSPPLNILKAGYYDTHSENAKYTEVQSPAVSQSDSTKTKISWIKISFAEPQLIDKISFEVKGPNYFLRDCQIGIREERILKNKRKQINFTPISDFKISSNGNNTSYLNNFRSKEFFIKIFNNDNPPLQIVSVQCCQINHCVIAYLKKNEAYSLVFGNEKAKTPDYDLINFKDSITSATLTFPGEISPIHIQEEDQKPERGIFSSNTFIWISLSAVILILGFMSIKIIKETK